MRTAAGIVLAESHIGKGSFRNSPDENAKMVDLYRYLMAGSLEPSFSRLKTSAMKKATFVGVIKVVCVDVAVILLSGLIGVSLNGSFVKGKQQTTFALERSNGKPVFKPIPASNPKNYPVFSGIELTEVKNAMQSGEMILLDGRSQSDYESGHLPGAYHLGVADFEKALRLFSSRFPKDTRFVIYCRGGDCSLSRRLAELLYDKGYVQLRIYWGGYNDWFLGGNPVEKGGGKNFLSTWPN
jgi:rhodanese-related sulfurtransferase